MDDSREEQTWYKVGGHTQESQTGFDFPVRPLVNVDFLRKKLC